MPMSLCKLLKSTLLGIAASVVCAAGLAAQPPVEPAAELPASTAPLWPRQFQAGNAAFTVYPPQVERWEGDRLDGRAAVAVQPAGSEAPVFGAISLSARTQVDATSAMVNVGAFTVTSGAFPTAGDRGNEYLDAVRRHLASLTWQVSRARLQADLAIDQATGRAQNEPLRNEPPRIVYVQSPTILVPIDGEPVLREIPGADLLRMVNTRALILQDKLTGHYFLHVAGYWLEAPTLEGRWNEAQVRPLTLDQAKQQAVTEGSVDLLDDEQPASSRLPNVIVSTGPTELVQTDGPPQYAPVGHGDLLFVTNSPNRLFLDLRTQAHYVLLAGRWYRTSSLARGTWTYVPGADLPRDFAEIPDGHPTASVLAAVPGTVAAQESVIANSVPQIATVKRSAARLEITYDGAPQFRPIPGTTLEAAANAPVPIIRVEGRTYYALDNGVWFFSESADGPWVAATSVPPVIYTIPRSHPLHYVTYVRVYDAVGDQVYVGYTPGYVGSYVTLDGTVVYGTGWYYTPWIGTVWYAAPVTWGFGFSFYYSWWNPWPWRAWWPAWRPVPCFRPAWGPWPYTHVGVRTFGVAVVAPGWTAARWSSPHWSSNWHDAAAVGRAPGRSVHRDNPGVPGGIYRRWDPHGAPGHGFTARTDAHRAVPEREHGPATAAPPLPRERMGPADRNQWSGQRQRPQAEAPHWVRPDSYRGQGNLPARSWDRAERLPDATNRHGAMEPPRTLPPRAPTGADIPRSRGLWRGEGSPPGNRGTIETRPHVPDRSGRTESRQQTQRDGGGWSRADRNWSPPGRDGTTVPSRSMERQPSGLHGHTGPRGANITRESPGGPRNGDMQRSGASPFGGPRINGPAFAPR